MEIKSTIKIAIRALARNKMRSALTMLGIIIGVGAVIAMVGVGQGASNQVQQRIANLGSNLLFVGSGTVNRNGQHMGWGATKTLTLEDYQAIVQQCPAVAGAAPGDGTGAQIVYENQNWNTRINGTTPSYFDVRNWPVVDGDAFTQSDVDTSANVAIIGDTIRKNLFGAVEPVGKEIRIQNLPFKVIGVLEPKGANLGMGRDQDDVVMAPITTLQKKLNGHTWLQWIMVSAKSRQASYAAQQQITGLLHDRHRIRAGQDDDFFVRNLADIAQMADQAGQVMTLLLASIASVSLIVGGIGIMNIMLVSVTERTREIGIRMAIGATESDVQRQFLTEAVVLSLMGGIIGILLGVSSSFLITHVLGWQVLISPASIVIAALFSTAVGVFFGYYPALKAAGLDPIEALRYE